MKPSDVSVGLCAERRVGRGARRPRRSQPLTDYRYQSFDLPARAGGGSNWGSKPPSLWPSYAEMKREATGVFIVEAIVFGLFAAVTGWGIALSAQTLFETLRAFAQL